MRCKLNRNTFTYPETAIMPCEYSHSFPVSSVFNFCIFFICPVSFFSIDYLSFRVSDKRGARRESGRSWPFRHDPIDDPFVRSPPFPVFSVLNLCKVVFPFLILYFSFLLFRLSSRSHAVRSLATSQYKIHSQKASLKNSSKK